MATTLNTIYPPQVDTFMPSFKYNESAKVWFKIPSYSEDKINLIKYIHISMVDQRNNINVFKGMSGSNTVYPQYYPIVFNKSKDNNNSSNNMGYDPNKKMYWLTIPPQILKTSPYYNIGQYYKVQLRFDLTGSEEFPANTLSNPTDFFFLNSSTGVPTANALSLASYTNYNEDNFSEWSTGTLIKPILIPNLSIQKFNTNTSTEINHSTDELIVGSINFEKVEGDNRPLNLKLETEQLSWYQIEILNSNINSNKIYEINDNQINYKIDVSTLTVGNDYQMQITYETNNGYFESILYPISIIDYKNNTDVIWNEDIDEESGVIVLNISDLAKYNNGYLIIKRSSYYSNFINWDLIAAYDISSLHSLTVKDNTIESMVGYRYQLQYMNINNNGSETYAPQYTNILHCDFYGSLFSDVEKTLKITFNFQPSNRANATNRTKIDTLGGQYPLFTQNSKLKYHTYSISGRISTEDGGELFLPKQEVFGNEYYNYRYNTNEITDTSVSGGESGSSAPIKKIQPNNDWLYEREYRDAVEEWLNNGKPKLFRSMTEGNMIIMLDAVGMVPDTVLGRRLYDFNSTMYEIGDGKNIESIASFGLFNIIDERPN